ncbi:unnamed protein product [Amoebophrya sp. A120]|nr:unnamed protein product [Amoebophrya sp. A120]|eukprot:GSA120T00018054001.1
MTREDYLPLRLKINRLGQEESRTVNEVHKQTSISEFRRQFFSEDEKNHHRIRFFHAGKYLAEETCTLEQYDIPAHACLHCFVTKDLAGGSASATAQTVDATMSARAPASAPSTSAAAEGAFGGGLRTIQIGSQVFHIGGPSSSSQDPEALDAQRYNLASSSAEEENGAPGRDINLAAGARPHQLQEQTTQLSASSTNPVFLTGVQHAGAAGRGAGSSLTTATNSGESSSSSAAARAQSWFLQGILPVLQRRALLGEVSTYHASSRQVGDPDAQAAAGSSSFFHGAGSGTPNGHGPVGDEAARSESPPQQQNMNSVESSSVYIDVGEDQHATTIVAAGDEPSQPRHAATVVHVIGRPLGGGQTDNDLETGESRTRTGELISTTAAPLPRPVRPPTVVQSLVQHLHAANDFNPDNIPEECRLGIHRDMLVIWPTLPGLLCGLCFYPYGMCCCLLHKIKRCPHCGYTVHSC